MDTPERPPPIMEDTTLPFDEDEDDYMIYGDYMSDDGGTTPTPAVFLDIPQTVRYSPDTPASRLTVETDIEHRYLPLIYINEGELPSLTGNSNPVTAEYLKLNAGAVNLDYFLAYIYVKREDDDFINNVSGYIHSLIRWINTTSPGHIDTIDFTLEQIKAALKRESSADHEKLIKIIREWHVQFDTGFLMSGETLGDILFASLAEDEGASKQKKLDFGDSDGGDSDGGDDLMVGAGRKVKSKRKKSKPKKSKKKKSKKKKSKSRKKYKSRKKSKESI